MKLLKIVYLATYIDEELEDVLDLPLFPAGLAKKKQLIDILTDHIVDVIFVSMFTRMRFKSQKKIIKRLSNHARLIVPLFITFPLLNYLINPILTYRALVNVNKERKTDVIILYNCVYENVLPAYIFKITHGTKLICQYEDSWFLTSKWPKSIIYKISHWLGLHATNAVIINCTNFLKILKKNHYYIFRGTVTQKIELKNNKFQVRTKKRLNVVFSSGIDKIRGSILLIDFFNNVNDKETFERFNFIVTGRGSEKIMKDMKIAVDKFKSIGGSAKYLGYVSNLKLKSIYHHADIFLALQNPHLRFSEYCFPSKIFEYYQYNVPIITTKISDLSNKDFINLNFIEFSIRSLKKTLNKVYVNYKIIKKNNSTNQERISNMYSIDKNRVGINRFLKILNE
jgi:hypothetical protein